MAVFKGTVALAWAGSTGSIDRDGSVEYLAVWHLQVDTPFDQAQNILIWWQENMFGLGAEYKYANDSFGSLATAQNIRAIRKPETSDWWNVEVSYTRETDNSKRTVDDQPATSDPLLNRPIVQCSSNAVTLPATDLHYLGGYSPRISAKLDGMIGMVPVSSNMLPFDPLPEVDKFVWYISVEMNLKRFDGNKSYVGFTNKKTFSVDYKGFTRWPVSRAQAKIRDCEVQFRREHTIDFWNVRYYFEVLSDGDDFLMRLPDIGMSALACDDDDDDMDGGHYGRYGGATPILPGRAKDVGIVDPRGMPIRSPVNLDGDGGVLEVCDFPVEFVSSTWWEGKEVDFNDVPVIQEILDAKERGEID